MGKVYLVGAGPGDPSLISVKGKQCLERADVVLYDYLAHPTLLTYCKAGCILVDVGKKRGLHRQTQDQINNQLVTYATSHDHVVRLKGGDPLIFGRGGEELQVLFEHHIPFEIVPGISSAIAGPAYSGIPLTHRELSRSVAFVTGALHAKENASTIKIPDADTLVFLMPVMHLSLICSKLLQRPSYSDDTPCAILMRMSTARQEKIIATIGTIEEYQDHIETPALFVVGDVVRFSDQFDWISEKQLFGKRIVFFRSLHQSHTMFEKLSFHGAEVIHFPLLQFSRFEEGFKQLTHHYISSLDGLIFTSQNGVDYFFEALRANGLDIRQLASCRILSIGEKTSEALKRRALQPDDEAELSTAEGIADLVEQYDISKGCCPTSTIGGMSLKKRCGDTVDILPLYKTEKPSHLSLSILSDDWLVFTSPSQVRYFFEEFDGDTSQLTAFCIGPTTEKELSVLFDGSIIVADESTEDGVIQSILQKAKHHDIQ